MVKKYTKTHEWIEEEGDAYKVGVTKYGLSQLGEIVYIELPKLDSRLAKGEESAVLESTKAAADYYSPITGVIVAINQALQNDLSLLNDSPEKEGWFFKIKGEKPEELSDLLTEQEYANCP